MVGCVIERESGVEPPQSERPNHRIIFPLSSFYLFSGFQCLFRLQRPMWRGEGNEEVKGVIFVFRDEPAGGIAKPIGNVAFFFGRCVIFQNHAVRAGFVIGEITA